MSNDDQYAEFFIDSPSLQPPPPPSKLSRHLPSRSPPRSSSSSDSRFSAHSSSDSSSFSSSSHSTAPPPYSHHNSRRTHHNRHPRSHVTEGSRDHFQSRQEQHRSRNTQADDSYSRSQSQSQLMEKEHPSTVDPYLILQTQEHQSQDISRSRRIENTKSGIVDPYLEYQTRRSPRSPSGGQNIIQDQSYHGDPYFQLQSRHRSKLNSVRRSKATNISRSCSRSPLNNERSRSDERNIEDTVDPYLQLQSRRSPSSSSNESCRDPYLQQQSRHRSMSFSPVRNHGRRRARSRSRSAQRNQRRRSPENRRNTQQKGDVYLNLQRKSRSRSHSPHNKNYRGRQSVPDDAWTNIQRRSPSPPNQPKLKGPRYVTHKDRSMSSHCNRDKMVTLDSSQELQIVNEFGQVLSSGKGNQQDNQQKENRRNQRGKGWKGGRRQGPGWRYDKSVSGHGSMVGGKKLIKIEGIAQEEGWKVENADLSEIGKRMKEFWQKRYPGKTLTKVKDTYNGFPIKVNAYFVEDRDLMIKAIEPFKSNL